MKYYAFISYSHKDKKIAQRLHKRLRSYHLPSKLIESHPELPKKLGTIFLDEANLVAKEGSLTESLREYLGESNYLILICSPDSAKSQYVNDEVKHFMSIGRRTHIVPLIVGGLPHSKDPNAECFVPAILDLPREIEPLGIDLKTYGERDAFLRVIATTLGLDLEYFVSIEERERRKRIAVFSSIAAVFVIGAGVFLWRNMEVLKVMFYDAEAQYNLAESYYSAKDYPAAVMWYERAIKSGYPDAQNVLAERCYEIGRRYFYGDGEERNYDEAMTWYERAANYGHAYSRDNLGKLYSIVGNNYYYGTDAKQDYEKAISWYEKAANHGYTDSQNKLGMIYHHGWAGVSRDYAKAFEWYSKAAANNHPDAQRNLGEMYEKGLEVKQDYTKALEWYEKSSDGNNITAQFTLGLIYHYARCGVKQDYAKAAKYYEKAANNNNRIAQRYLAGLYVHGLGVTQDYAKAIELYRKAADNGDPEAQIILKEIYSKAGLKR